MKRKKFVAFTCVILLLFVFFMSACGKKDAKTKVRVLIVPKFEIGEITGDFPGEAQLFYEYYCAGCEEIAIAHTTPTAHFYLKEESGVGLLITGSGKTAAGLSLMSLLSDDTYDFSDTIIVSVGCSGGNTGFARFGDVVLVTAACDLELGHHTDKAELTDPDNSHTWFPDESDENDYACKQMDPELCDKAYQLIKDCSLRTTDITDHVLADNFPNEEWAQRKPCVLKGTAISTDSYWKGAEDHANAAFAAEYYGCDDKYAVTEMEEIAVMNAAECFGLENRVISLRVVVNSDTFLKGESPEQLWLDEKDFEETASAEKGETVDIFEPGMESLFDTGRIIIDAILAGEF